MNSRKLMHSIQTIAIFFITAISCSTIEYQSPRRFLVHEPKLANGISYEVIELAHKAYFYRFPADRAGMMLFMTGKYEITGDTLTFTIDTSARISLNIGRRVSLRADCGDRMRYRILSREQQKPWKVELDSVFKNGKHEPREPEAVYVEADSSKLKEIMTDFGPFYEWTRVFNRPGTMDDCD